MGQKRRGRKMQRGAVLVEASIALPFLLFVSIESVVVGLAVSAQGELSRIAYEGSRTAVSTPGIVVHDRIDGACDPHPTPECAISLRTARDRMNRLLADSWIRHLGSINYRLALEECGGRRFINLTIDFDSRSLPAQLPHMFGSMVQQHLRAPYLFPGR